MANENDQREAVPAPLLRSVRFVAERHDWPIPFIYRLIKEGLVKAYRQGEKMTVIDVATADAYAVSRPIDLAEHAPVAAIKALAAKRAKAKADAVAKTKNKRRSQSGARRGRAGSRVGEVSRQTSSLPRRHNTPT